MAMSVDEKAVVKTYLSRKLRTIPFLILMVFSLLPLCMFSFDWVRGQLWWHKTEATVILVNEDGGGFYRYANERTGETYSGTYYPYRILIHYQIGQSVKANDTIRMSYNPKNPSSHVLFPKLELRIVTWLTVFVFCFVIYFWLEWTLKKRAKIKIPG